MSISDPLSDVITRIRNAQLVKKENVVVPVSKLHDKVLEVLKREGYIRGYKTETVRPGIRQTRVEIKYHEGQPVITKIWRVSKPGRRVYVSSDVPPVCNGLGISILSTSSGIVSDTEAREKNVGGELLFNVI